MSKCHLCVRTGKEERMKDFGAQDLGLNFCPTAHPCRANCLTFWTPFFLTSYPSRWLDCKVLCGCAGQGSHQRGCKMAFSLRWNLFLAFLSGRLQVSAVIQRGKLVIRNISRSCLWGLRLAGQPAITLHIMACLPGCERPSLGSDAPATCSLHNSYLFSYLELFRIFKVL